MRWPFWHRSDAPRRSWGTIGRPVNERVVIVLVIGWALLGVLWARCCWLQVLGAGRYLQAAKAQHFASQKLLAQRGVIYDRDGRPLAVSVPAPSVFANARRIGDKSRMASKLGALLDRDTGAIRQRLDRDKGFVWVARQVDYQLTPGLLAMQRDGIGIVEEPKRLYPQGTLAGHLLGFVNVDGHGLEGMELTFDRVLRGRDGLRSTLRDARGQLLVGPWTVNTPPADGQELVLTLDSVVQQAAEEALSWGVKKYHAKGGTIIVMDPATGEILAMANQPAIDPNDPTDTPTAGRRNRAVTDVFEPGSIFKMVTASALLQEGRITPEEKIFCENGSWPTVGGHILHDHHGQGTLTFADVIKFSSNIGTSKAAQRLKPEEFMRYVQAFGFGRKTGIDVPGEVSGILPPLSRWSKLTPYIMPIGQEVAVTPVQLAVMVGVIANGGLRVQPRVVKQVQDANGNILSKPAVQEPVRVISAETAKTVQDMLVKVVESGTGQLASVQGLTVAGKTGTAQKLEPNGRYSHSRFVASFVGFGPVPDPRFVIIVSVDEPHPLYFGGVVSAPLFKRMVEQLASYWGLERTPPQPVPTQT